MMMTQPARNADSCAPWCVTHADEDCMSTPQVLTTALGEVGVYLLRTPSGVVEIMLDVDSGRHVAEIRLDLEQARALAGSVNMLVPAPRPSSD